MRTWNLRDKNERIITRERGPPCTNLGGDLLGEERGPTLACLMGRSSPLDRTKTKEKNQELLLSSSSGRFSQEETRKTEYQEAGSDQNHHHKEDRSQQEALSFSSSITINNLCNTRLTRDRTYRGVEHLRQGQEAGSCQVHRLRHHGHHNLGLHHRIRWNLLQNHLILAGELLRWISYHAADWLTECVAAQL